MACDLSLRLMGRSLPSFAGWSGYPSIAALSINPGIDVMGQADSCSATDCINRGPGNSLDHLVSEREQLVRHGQAERFDSLEVDDELEP